MTRANCWSVTCVSDFRRTCPEQGPSKYRYFPRLMPAEGIHGTQ
jgi:hypothetical protein